MNNKGSSFLMNLLTFFIIFAAGVMFINFVIDDVDSFRGSQSLNCDSTSISDGAKVLCLGVDLLIPYIIVGILSIGGTFLISRLNI